MKRLACLFLVLPLAACVTAPKPLQGQYAAILPSQAAQANAQGQAVRWGGRVVKVEPKATQTCFEIVGVRGDSSGRPEAGDRSDGRFLACRAGFYDPEVFKPGREVTITGTIEKFETRSIGEYAYAYPLLAADVVYLWPERKDVDLIVERPLFVW